MTSRWPRRRVTRGSPGTARGRAAAGGRGSLRSMAELPGGGTPAAGAAEITAGWTIAGQPRVIALRLEHLSELFEPPETDLFHHGRHNYYLTGIDFAISELRGRPFTRHPVRLEISVPAAEVVTGGDDAVARAVRNYCAVRIRYNRSERLGAVGDGVASLKVGLPVAGIGIALAAISPTGILGDVIGAVLTWVGLWYPLDQLLFYPWECTRENRPLRVLALAEVALLPRGPEPADGQPRPVPPA